MKPYIVLAVNNGYKVHIMEPDTPWKFNPRVLAHKNSHGVPLFKIRQMFERYQRHLNLDTLLDQWNLVAKPEIIKEPSPPPVNCQNDDEEEIFQSDPEDFYDEE